MATWPIGQAAGAIKAPKSRSAHKHLLPVLGLAASYLSISGQFFWFLQTPAKSGKARKKPDKQRPEYIIHLSLQGCPGTKVNVLPVAERPVNYETRHGSACRGAPRDGQRYLRRQSMSPVPMGTRTLSTRGSLCTRASHPARSAAWLMALSPTSRPPRTMRGMTRSKQGS